MMQLMISALTTWMSDTGIDLAIVVMVKDILLAKGQRSIVECLGIQVPKYVRLAKFCDRIRYDGLVEGRIANFWL